MPFRANIIYELPPKIPTFLSFGPNFTGKIHLFGKRCYHRIAKPSFECTIHPYNVCSMQLVRILYRRDSSILKSYSMEHHYQSIILA